MENEMSNDAEPPPCVVPKFPELRWPIHDSVKWARYDVLADWPVLAISGYKRSGKDTLAGEIATGAFRLFDGWCVFRRSGVGALRQLSAFRGAALASFAAPIKARVYRRLGWTEADHPYEEWKEREADGSGATVRDMMIAEGAEGRAADASYWVKAAILPIYRETVICRDNRYPNELAELRTGGADVVTARVFRSEVPVAPAADSSEHSVDLFGTDYLVVRDADEFARACALWPAYSTYYLLSTPLNDS